MIKWGVDILSKNREKLCEYTFEYLTALLLNLSLRTVGQNKYDEIKYTALNLYYELLSHPNEDIRVYVTGTLYSLFSMNSIKKLAIEMNFESQLEKLIISNQEEEGGKYTFVL